MLQVTVGPLPLLSLHPYRGSAKMWRASMTFRLGCMLKAAARHFNLGRWRRRHARFRFRMTESGRRIGVAALGRDSGVVMW